MRNVYVSGNANRHELKDDENLGYFGSPHYLFDQVDYCTELCNSELMYKEMLLDAYAFC
jgi:hypothetical protein